MELIRRDTDYALRVLIELAQPGRRDAPAPVNELVDRAGVPRDFLHKILRRLAGAGIVQGRSGRGGGFWLIRRPGDITLLEVVEAVQGPPAISQCLLDDGVCSRTPHCPVRKSLEGLQQQLTSHLAAARLSDIVPGAAPKRKRPARPGLNHKRPAKRGAHPSASKLESGKGARD